MQALCGETFTTMRPPLLPLLLLACTLSACMKSDLEECVDAAMARILEEREDEIEQWPPGAMDIVKAGYQQQCQEKLLRKP